MNTGRLTCTAVVTAVILASTSAATAQNGITEAAQDADPAGTEAAVAVSETQLRQFATVRAEVLALQHDFTKQISESDDDAQAQALRSQAQQAMTEVVERGGLDLETYNRLTVRLETDPGFRVRVEQLDAEQAETPRDVRKKTAN